MRVKQRTIERLRVRLSEDAIQLAINYVVSGQLFYIIFDNINIYLRKAEQRLHHLNEMIHATNAAIIPIPDVDPKFEDLDAFHKLRGERSKATVGDGSGCRTEVRGRSTDANRFRSSDRADDSGLLTEQS